MHNCENPFVNWQGNLKGRDPTARDMLTLANSRNVQMRTDQHLQQANTEGPVFFFFLHH